MGEVHDGRHWHWQCVIRQVPLRFGVGSGQSARSRPRETRPGIRVVGPFSANYWIPSWIAYRGYDKKEKSSRCFTMRNLGVES